MTAGSAASPKRATFFPLLACNAKCPFCSTRVYTPGGVVSNADYVSGRSRRIDELTYDFESACAEYRRLRDNGVDSIAIQGGEPTLFARLGELVAYGKQIGIREQIVVTNGRRFADAGLAADLFKSGLDAIAFSIFGSAAELHDASLGAVGSFADAVRGVRNLVELGSPTIGPSLTGQLLVHAKNYHDLPEMLAFWHSLGIRVFGIRLLRETANTTQASPDEWFFDLERLRQPLAETLDVARRLPVRVDLAELFHCLVDPEHLPWLLEGTTTRLRLQDDHLLATRTELRVLNYAESHRPRTHDDRLAACDRCDLRASCVKIEDQYLPLYSGSLVPLDLERAIGALATGVVSDRTLERLVVLLERPELLFGAGISASTADALTRRLFDAVARRGPACLAGVVLTERGRDEIASFARRAARPPVVRLVPAVELGVRGPFDPSGGARVALERLCEGATGNAAAKARFLLRADPLAAGPWILVFGGEVARGRGPAYCAAVHDDRVPADHLERVIRAVLGARPS